MTWTTAAIAVLSLSIERGGATGIAALQQEQARAAFTEAGCDRCHSVESAGIEAKVKGKLAGPTLDEPRPERTREWYQGYLRKSEEVNGKTHPVSWKGDDQQLKTVVDWLVELQAESSAGSAR